MAVFEYFQLLFSDYTLRTITLGTATLGAISGMLGSFAVMRKQSLIGDTISHAALPGIAIAFLLMQAKDNHFLLVGALISGLLGTLLISGITKRTHLKTDTAMGIVLSVFFGFGMLLLTYIQKIPNANQAGLDKYLFGQAATLMENDVRLLIYVLGGTLIVLFLFWKEFKVLLFDEDYAKTIGVPTKSLDILITVFIVLAIILGLQTVGVVLMSALILAPAAAARQWTNNFGKMLFIASLFGILSGVTGTMISTTQDNLPTGPVIVIVSILFVFISFVFSPTRGILNRQIHFYRNKKKLIHRKMLLSLAENSEKSFSEIIANQSNFNLKELKVLESKGWISLSGKEWKFTEKGEKYIQKLNQF